jgi:hypothetical protein
MLLRFSDNYGFAHVKKEREKDVGGAKEKPKKRNKG